MPAIFCADQSKPYPPSAFGNWTNSYHPTRVWPLLWQNSFLNGDYISIKIRVSHRVVLLRLKRILFELVPRKFLKQCHKTHILCEEMSYMEKYICFAAVSQLFEFVGGKKVYSCLKPAHKIFKVFTCFQQHFLLLAITCF